jgi:uncharacterized protein (DUF1810 family)
MSVSAIAQKVGGHTRVMADPFDLQRFVDAQEGTYETALQELRDGHKRSHWMWFVFPQIAGLGRSPMAQRYAISGLDEARAYLQHPILGARLRDCVDALLGHHNRSADAIMGGIDAVKLRSSMTLFARAVAAGGGDNGGDAAQPFEAVLDRFFGGEHDQATDARL